MCMSGVCISGMAEWLQCLLAKLMVLSLNLTMPQKLTTIYCLHDGRLDVESAPQSKTGGVL